MCVSMLARIVESVRMPSRSGPASEPMSSTFTRWTPAHGSGWPACSRAGCSVSLPLLVMACRVVRPISE